MQNSVQNGRGGTRPSRKHYNGLNPAIGGTISASSGFVLQETQSHPIPSVNLRALCEKWIRSFPAGRRGRMRTSVSIRVHPWSKPVPSDSRPFAFIRGEFLPLSRLESAGWEMPSMLAATRWLPPACRKAD